MFQKRKSSAIAAFTGLGATTAHFLPSPKGKKTPPNQTILATTPQPPVKQNTRALPMKQSNHDQYALIAKVNEYLKLKNKTAPVQRPLVTQAGWCFGLDWIWLPLAHARQENTLYEKIHSIIDCPEEELLKMSDLIEDLLIEVEKRHRPHKPVTYQCNGKDPYDQDDIGIILNLKKAKDGIQGDYKKTELNEKIFKYTLGPNQLISIKGHNGKYCHHVAIISRDQKYLLRDSHFKSGEHITVEEKDLAEKVWESLREKNDRNESKTIKYTVDVFYPPQPQVVETVKSTATDSKISNTLNPLQIKVVAAVNQTSAETKSQASNTKHLQKPKVVVAVKPTPTKAKSQEATAFPPSKAPAKAGLPVAKNNSAALRIFDPQQPYRNAPYKVDTHNSNRFVTEYSRAFNRA